MRCAEGDNRAINRLPHIFAELDVFDILCEIVQSAEQAEWIAKRGYGCLTQTRRHSQPGLLTQIHHDPILHFLDGDGECRLPAGHGTHAGCHLDRHFLLIADHLGVQVAAVKFSHQGLRDVVRFDVSVKNSPVHVFDYNPLLSDDVLSSYSISI